MPPDGWIDMLSAFFQARGDALSQVLDARSCREGWLHGELFRWFRHRCQLDSFKVNALPIGKRKTADISTETPSRMVGEIKIIGRDYETKNITGASIKPFLSRLDRPIMPTDRHLAIGRFALIVDFFRLVDFGKQDDRDALLILILDERSAFERSLARTLRAINFVGPSTDVAFSAGLVRMWIISHDTVPPGA